MTTHRRCGRGRDQRHTIPPSHAPLQPSGPFMPLPGPPRCFDRQRLQIGQRLARALLPPRRILVEHLADHRFHASDNVGLASPAGVVSR